MEYGYTGVHAYQGVLRGRHIQTRNRFAVPALCISMFCSLFAGTVMADEASLLVNGIAIHLNPPANKNLNEKNWGAGFQYDWTPINQKWVPFATASVFKDSNRNMSYYAGGGFMHRWNFGNMHVDAGAVGFLMVRKNFKNDRPFPGALPAFSVGTQRVSVNMTYIPKVEPKAVPLVFFQLKIALGSF